MKYAALTIGPIIKSLELAHKTRELWAASYFFSDLMQTIIQELNKNDKIILPFPEMDKIIANQNIDEDKIKSAGVFPDRLILEGSHFIDLQNAVNNAITALHKKYHFSCDEDQLKSYLNTYIIEFEYSPRNYKKDRNGKNNDNIIFQSYDFLADCELQAQYTSIEPECFINMFNKISTAGFYKNLFGKSGFPSIPEIATRGLNTEGITWSEDNDVDDDSTKWKGLIKQNNNELKINKKYFAIVQADGDNVSKIISSIAEDTDNVKEFSKALSTFSLKAAELIQESNGEPVYAGGDDLLFFAPVTSDKGNIFDIIKEIDDIFKNEVIDKYPAVSPKPSMSYGISISYYKYPMHEALKNARQLLFEKAKENPKDQIALKLLRHSGQTTEVMIQKPFDQNFLDLIGLDIGLATNSVLHNLTEQKTILKGLLPLKDRSRFENFFHNFYDEDAHKKRNFKQLSGKVINMLMNEFAKDNNAEKVIERVKAQLYIVKFLNDKDHD